MYLVCVQIKCVVWFPGSNLNPNKPVSPFAKTWTFLTQLKVHNKARNYHAYGKAAWASRCDISTGNLTFLLRNLIYFIFLFLFLYKYPIFYVFSTHIIKIHYKNKKNFFFFFGKDLLEKRLQNLVTGFILQSAI